MEGGHRKCSKVSWNNVSISFLHIWKNTNVSKTFLKQEAASECKISDNLTIERREDYWTVSDLQSALFGSSDSSILEQRLNFIFTHSEEYQMSLRPFLQEAASAKKWQYNNREDGRILDLHREVRIL